MARGWRLGSRLYPSRLYPSRLYPSRLYPSRNAEADRSQSGSSRGTSAVHGPCVSLSARRESTVRISQRKAREHLAYLSAQGERAPCVSLSARRESTLVISQRKASPRLIPCQGRAAPANQAARRLLGPADGRSSRLGSGGKLLTQISVN